MGGGAHGAEGQTKPAERGSEGRCTGRSHRLCPRAGEGGGEALAHVAAVAAVPCRAVLRRSASRSPPAGWAGACAAAAGTWQGAAAPGM